MIHTLDMYHPLMAQIRKGTTAWIILATLKRRGELYGYGLRREVFAKSKGLFSIQEGPLYSLLKKMERKRWITSHCEEVGGRERRYYRISTRGRQVLGQYRREWKLLSSMLGKLGCHRA
ncbi:MAG: PadR family transcriptional regulator [Verrucomicrobiia bacterium]